MNLKTNGKLPNLLQESMDQPSATSGGAAPAAPIQSDPVSAVDPAAAPATEEIDASGPSASDVELFQSGDDDVSDLETTPAAPAAKPAAPAATPVEPAPAAAQPAAAATPAAPAAAKPVEPAAPPAAAPAQPAAPAAETTEAKQAREAAAAAEEEKLFKGLTEFYKLPDDMSAKLATEPELVLPVLAAKVHQAVVKGVQQMLAHELPFHVMQTQRVQAAEQASKDAFYKAWPGLREHEQQVLQAGKLWRSMNPGATSEEAIKAIGTIVSQSMGIAVAAPAASAPAAAATPPSGFKPAGTGGAAPAAPAKSDNEFTAMAEESE